VTVDINFENAMITEKMMAGAIFPPLEWSTVAHGAVTPAQGEGWRIVIVYRGAHCPLCKAYLNELNEMLDAFADAGMTILTLSADTLEKARNETQECGWNFPVGYDLTTAQMRVLGLYISDPRSPEETDHQFSEPGVFVINPRGETQIIDVSNAPFARPALPALLKGLQFIISNNYPIRGRA
jgi:peroxiredoxin